MKFVKGHTPWNKGMPMRLESKKKLSNANTGKSNPNKGKGSSHQELLKRFESKIEILITNCWRWKGFVENTYFRPDGSRDCRICHCIAQKKYLQNKKRGVDVQ